MKTIIVSVFCLILQMSSAQAIPVLTNICSVSIGGPTKLHASGTDMYFSKNPIDKVVKFDATLTTPNPTDIVFEPDALEISDMIVIGTDLYFASFGGGKIYKQDLTNSSSPPTVVLSGLHYPNGMVLKNNEIYFTESDPGVIQKFDMTLSSPVLDTIMTGLLFPSGLAFNGNDLYVSESGADKIIKIDVSSSSPVATDVLTGLDNPLGIRVKNNFLVFAVFLENRVAFHDLADPTSGAVDLATVDKPSDVQFIGEDLFICEKGGNMISKLQNVGLSLNEDSFKKIAVFPNPTADFISILNASKDVGYSIIGFDGKELMSGDTVESDKIDLRRLNSGVYVLNLSNGITMKIIKK